MVILDVYGKTYGSDLRDNARGLISRVFESYLQNNFEVIHTDDLMKEYKGLDKSYIVSEDYKMTEKINEYCVNFLKKYFKAPALRDLVVIDNFFDKPLFS